MTPRSSRLRLDVALVQTGLARSRARASQLIGAGTVLVEGVTVTKPSHPVEPGDELTLSAEPDRWVSRAAYKLLGALSEFGAAGLRIEGRRCIDAGASTGGFTQVLLAHGAREVVALDVGHGQLVAEIAADPRVVEHSGCNVRDVTAAELGGVADVVVADLSFISLPVVLSSLIALTAEDGDLVVLIKPQFEVGRERLGKGGVVRAPAERRRSILGVLNAATAQGMHPHGLSRSSVAGSTGNVEYLLWLRRDPAGMMNEDEAAQVADMITREASHAVATGADAPDPAGGPPETS